MELTRAIEFGRESLNTTTYVVGDNTLNIATTGQDGFSFITCSFKAEEGVGGGGRGGGGTR